MPPYPVNTAFRSASVILPPMDKTVSLSKTVDMILAEVPADVREFLIVVCERTTRESMAVAAALRSASLSFSNRSPWHTQLAPDLVLNFRTFDLDGRAFNVTGGLGGFEVVMAFLLARLAAPAPAATIAIVIFRLCTLWLFSPIGVIFMFAWTIFIAQRPSLQPGRQTVMSPK